MVEHGLCRRPRRNINHVDVDDRLGPHGRPGLPSPHPERAVPEHFKMPEIRSRPQCSQGNVQYGPPVAGRRGAAKAIIAALNPTSKRKSFLVSRAMSGPARFQGAARKVDKMEFSERNRNL